MACNRLEAVMRLSLPECVRSRRVALVATIAVLFSGFAVYRAVHRTSVGANSPSGGEGGVLVPDSGLNFGEAWETTSFTWRVPFTNRSDHVVAVEDISGSCNCTTVRPKALSKI